ncbi:hypothetical protein ACIP5N_27675 [Streptomyces sp. NPDC088768]|uniref:hypothetical protein n=1 Tax=Streptomyces sp. NPDC088768 TaxID=3365894 RepID=UPI0037F8E9FC
MDEEAARRIGREILRVDEALEDDRAAGGKRSRAEFNTRRSALRWSLHAVLGGSPAEPPGDAVDAFLRALRDAGDQR